MLATFDYADFDYAQPPVGFNVSLHTFDYADFDYAQSSDEMGEVRNWRMILKLFPFETD